MNLRRFLVCLAAILFCNSWSIAQTPSAAREREFEFEYGAAVTGLPAGATVRVWLPVAQSGPHQQVDELAEQLPGPAKTTQETTYGNKIRYFTVTAPGNGTLQWVKRYRVVRHEVRALERPGSPDRLNDGQRALFLAPNSRVPVKGKSNELLRDIALPETPLEVARALYDVVDDHVTYDKSKPGYGNGDVNWVCDSRFGNCTDFHSLFISLARGQNIPARFEIGFPLPPEQGEGSIGGYHCWGLFHLDNHGWVPVDISEADKHPEMKQYYFGNLTADRVTFSIGRDLQLVPRQTGPPLNYFVYPHIEVDGEVWPNDQVELQFRYQDVNPTDE